MDVVSTPSASIKKVSFPGAYGFNLSASLELPSRTPKAFALFAHCFTCSKDTLAAVRISRALTAFGIAVLRFDFTGLGSSDGDFANTNFSGNVSDLLQAVNFLRSSYQAPQILIGHSFGGAAILSVAAQVPEAKAVITIGAPADPTDIKHLLTEKIEEIKTSGEAEVELGHRKFKIKKQFLDDLEKTHFLNKIPSLNKTLLIFHSPQDEIVNIKNAEEIFNAAKFPKSFISLDGADHLLSRREDAIYVAKILSTWAAHNIPDQQQPETNTEKEPEHVIVNGTKADGFTQQIIIRNHDLIGDEPITSGGKNLGPTPYEYLLASLGACKAITLRMYAELKQIPLETVLVRLTHYKVHIDDCKDCENKNAKIDKIDVELQFTGNLTFDQRTRLLQIADHCPVHRTLTSKIDIETKLVDELT